MGIFKESVIIAFLAAQGLALPAPAATTTYACNPAHSYPAGVTCDGQALTLITPAPSSTSAYKCNPAHSYPGGVSCDGQALTLVTPAPSSSSPYKCNPAHSYPGGVSCDGQALTLITPAPSSSSAYKCNPAHSYPGGVSCDGQALTLITPTPSASSSAYLCNPAHSYPGGVSCDATARTLIYPSTSAPVPAASTPAVAPVAESSSKCPLDLKAGTFEYPHLLEVNGVNGYFGGVNSTANTTFTFDIPASDKGKMCNTYFILPAKGTMETSDYQLTTAGDAKIHVSESKHGEVASFIPKEDEDWLVFSEECPAGGQIKYNMGAEKGINLSWFQDYNPCAVGMYVIVS